MPVTPVGYPSLGAWAFFNVDRATAFFPLLPSISIVESNPDDVSVLSATIVDRPETAVFEAEDEIWAEFAGARMFFGHIKVRGRTQLSEAGVRVFDIEAQDHTPKLDDTIIRRRIARKREKVKRRVKWLMRKLHFPMETDLSGLPDEFVDEQDYFGWSILDAIEALADEKRLHYEVDFDADQDGLALFKIFRTDATTAPFSLDDLNPDFVASFPYTEFRDDDASAELTNAVLVEPENRNKSLWVTDAASIAEFDRQESFVSDAEKTKRRQARNVGERALAENDQPVFEGQAMVHEPGLRAGQTIGIKNDTWGLDYSRVITSVEITAVESHNAEGKAHLFSFIRFSDRRRPNRHGRPGRGGGGPNKNTRRRRGRNADTDTHAIDDIGRIVATPGAVDGASVGTWIGEQMYRYTQDTFGLFPPLFAAVGGLSRVGSYIGGYRAHTQRTGDSGCAGFDNQFTGWKETEVWWQMVVPAHPADAYGIKTQVKLGVGSGFGHVLAGGVYEAVVLSSAPTATRQGAVVGELLANDTWTDITVPQGEVPAEAGTIFVGLRSKWQADYEDWTCGWTWPFQSPENIHAEVSGNPWSGYSGRSDGPAIQTPIWQTSVAPASYGATISYDNEATDDTPWDGPNDWVDLGVEGSPVSYAMDGSCLVLTADDPAGKGFAILGEREDSTQPWAAWSDFDWNGVLHFEVSRTGSLAAAGQRHLELVTVGEGERYSAKVHLGDAARAPGISVAGPAGQVYIAKTITAAVQMRARFDTRAGELRGKVWRKTDGQPAEWDVITPLTETEDDGDRIELWLRAGDSAAPDHVLHLCHIAGGIAAPSGDRVVKEYLGRAGGLTATFRTSHRYERASLRVWINGHGVRPVVRDAEGSSFTLDFKPTRRSTIRATYVAA